jgi:hypothetical protein
MKYILSLSSLKISPLPFGIATHTYFLSRPLLATPSLALLDSSEISTERNFGIPKSH